MTPRWTCTAVDCNADGIPRSLLWEHEALGRVVDDGDYVGAVTPDMAIRAFDTPEEAVEWLEGEANER